MKTTLSENSSEELQEIDFISVEEYSGTANYWEVLGLFTLVLAGVVGNILVCLAVCVEKKLQNVTNYFLVSLAIADLFVSLVVMPGSIAQEFKGHWPFGLALCTTWQICDVTMCTSSIMHMCTISLDRYLGVRDPIKTRNRSRLVVAIKISSVWVFSLAIASPVVILGIYRPHEIFHPVTQQCAVFNSYFLVYGSIAAFFGPLVIMLVTYSLTIRLLSKRARQLEMRSNDGMRRSMTRRKSSTEPMLGLRCNQQRLRPAVPIAGALWSPLSSAATTESSMDEMLERARQQQLMVRTSESSGFLEPRPRYLSEGGDRFIRYRRSYRASVGTESSLTVPSSEAEKKSEEVAAERGNKEKEIKFEKEKVTQKESLESEISERESSSQCKCKEEKPKARGRVTPKIGELEHAFFSQQKYDDNDTLDSSVNHTTDDQIAEPDRAAENRKKLQNWNRNSGEADTEDVECATTKTRCSVDLGTRRRSSTITRRKLKRSFSSLSACERHRYRERDSRLVSSFRKFDLKTELMKLHNSSTSQAGEGCETKIVEEETTEGQNDSITNAPPVETLIFILPTSDTSDTGLETQTTASNKHENEEENKKNGSTFKAKTPAYRSRLSKTYIKQELSRRFSIRHRIRRQSWFEKRRGETRNNTDDSVISAKPQQVRTYLTPGGYDEVSDQSRKYSFGSCSGDDPSSSSLTVHGKSWIIGSSSNCSESESRYQSSLNPPTNYRSPVKMFRRWCSEDSEEISGSSSATPREPPRVFWTRRRNSSVKLELRSLVRRHGASIRLAAGIFLTTNSSIDEGTDDSSSARYRRGGSSSGLYAVKTERKAVKVLGTMFFIFVISWASFFCLNLAMGVCSACEIDARIFKCFLWLGYASSMLNPIVYTIFNKSFKRTFVQLLTCARCQRGRRPTIVESGEARRGLMDRGDESGLVTGRCRSATFSAGSEEPLSRHRLSKVEMNLEASSIHGGD